MFYTTPQGHMVDCRIGSAAHYQGRICRLMLNRAYLPNQKFLGRRHSAEGVTAE